MKRIVAAAGAALIAMSLVGTAQAVPIYFDFTGTITGASYSYPLPAGAPTTVEGYALGEAVSGGFNFETDRLYDAGTFGFQHSWVDWQPANLTEPLTFLSFGGRDVALPVYPSGSNYTYISFVDACTPTCNPGWMENFNLFTTSTDQEITTADFTGTTHRSSLFVSSAAYFSVPDYPYSEHFDYFDGATVDPLSIVSLPLFTMIGIYSEETVNCVAGACTNQSLQFNFSLDSVSRGVGPRTSVPEPGTLGLLGAAAFGLLLFGRRRTARR
jgi:hypothetical protein